KRTDQKKTAPRRWATSGRRRSTRATLTMYGILVFLTAFGERERKIGGSIKRVYLPNARDRASYAKDFQKKRTIYRDAQPRAARSIGESESQTRTVASPEPEMRRVPSGLQATA